MTERWFPALRGPLAPELRWDTIAVAAIAVGAALRIFWVVLLHNPVDHVFSDMRGYVVRAEHFASGEPLRPMDALYPPGTQVLLGIPLRVFGLHAGLWVAAMLWCALSIAVVWMSWRLTKEVLTPAAASLTTVMCALWPLFITYGGFFTSETPALAFLLAALWFGVLATRSDGRTALFLALASGLMAGVAAAIRPQVLLNMLVMAILICVAFRKKIAPLATFGASLLCVLTLVVMHNSVAADRPTGLATNGGLNFWFGHCDARQVITLDDSGEQTAWFTLTVPNSLGRGGDYVFRGVDVWDERFFFGLGFDCIKREKAGHVFRLARNALDMTATTVPFPQSEEPGWARVVVQVTNVAYAVLLPWFVIESLFLIRRRRKAGQLTGEAFMLMNFACAAVVAVVFVGDPRIRSVYDVFGLALLAAVLADRLHLDGPDDANGGAVQEE
jgi:4-amino-4-deoxy-L-arabinose transferase-like glycosyltransferase